MRKYIGLIFGNLLAIGLIIGILSVPQSKFEVMVISILLLIFTAVCSGCSTLLIGQSKAWNLAYRQHIDMRMLLKYEDKGEEELYSELVKSYAIDEKCEAINDLFRIIIILVIIVCVIKSLYF